MPLNCRYADLIKLSSRFDTVTADRLPKAHKSNAASVHEAANLRQPADEVRKGHGYLFPESIAKGSSVQAL